MSFRDSLSITQDNPTIILLQYFSILFAVEKRRKKEFRREVAADGVIVQRLQIMEFSYYGVLSLISL